MKIVQFTVPVSLEESIVVLEDIRPNFYKHLHRHKEIQITWILKGTGTLIVSGNVVEFAENDIYIMGSNQDHVFKANVKDEKKNNIHAISIYFSPWNKLKGLFDLPEMKKLEKFIESTACGFKVPSAYEWSVSKSIQDINNHEGIKRLTAFMSMIDILANIKKYQSLTTSAITNKLSEDEGLRMNDIYQYTINNFSKEISIPSIASIAHMTPEAFCRYFKKHTHKTYHTFLNEMRIHEACKLLIQNNSQSIGEIAHNTGFTNAVNFNRVFKKMKLMTPLEFQKKYIIEN